MSYPEAGRLSDAEGRRRRARRMLRVLAELGGVNLATARLLDVGASHGLMTLELARATAAATGIDVDAAAIAAARATAGAASSTLFVVASGEALPFADAQFEVVVCNHVYEHVADTGALMREIHRVLVPGGTCYFAGGHTLQLIEPHYRLPLLSWLPRGWASAWLRRTGRGQRYDESFLMPWRVRGLFTQFASAELASAQMLRDPGGYGIGPAWMAGPLRSLPGGVLRTIALWLPTQVWLLRR